MLYKLLAGIYHKLSRFGPVEKMGDIYLQGFPWDLWTARRRMAKQLSERDNTHEVIKVVFVLMDRFNWNVLRPVYEAAKEDPGFQAEILVVPDTVWGTGDAALRMLTEMYGEEAVTRADTDGGWFDLEGSRPDYVFLPQPYDQYMPEPYKSHVIARYARVCFTPYGFVMFHNTESVGLNGRFCRNTAIFFADSPHTLHLQQDRFPTSHRMGIQKTVAVGYPPLVEYADLKKTRHLDKMTITWTPRWSSDPALGGSSFLPLKDDILNYAETHEDTALIFRPHPSLFYHFIGTGKITEEEKEAYLKRIEENDRIEYDTQTEFKPAFAEADVLITDVSSILMPWIVTGKPMIYCHANATFNPYVRPLQEGMYTAENWEDVEKYLEMLRNGDDPLKEKREELLASGIVIFDKDTPKRFLQTLREDYQEKH